jgi:tryptophanyl-tRNA synthetase
VADDIGSAGAATLKNTVSEAINEYLAPIRARRNQLAQDRSYIRQVLREGNERATTIADATLNEVRAAMNNVY